MQVRATVQDTSLPANPGTNVMGKDVWFDDNNSAGRWVVLQTVKDRKVGVADIVEVK